jgi:nitrous oxidase accessory protein
MSSMKKRLGLLIALILLSSLVILPHATVKAQSKTIIVPDDYPTITAAIGNATNGDTILVRSGTYQEHTLIINKTLTIIGEGTSNTILKNIDSNVWNPATEFLPPVTYAINITANNVKISDLTINPGSVAIYAAANGTQIIGNNIPDGEIMLYGSNQTFAYNTASGLTSDVICKGSYNCVLNNDVAGSVERGIQTSGSFNVIYGNQITATTVSADSLVVDGNGNIVAKNNEIDSGLDISGTSNTISGNVINYGTIAILGNYNTFFANNMTEFMMGNTHSDASYNTFYDNNFVSNGYFEVIVWSAVKGPDFFDNGNEGNYWSNYNGTDVNNVGIGDTPYIMYTNDSRNYAGRTAAGNIANLVFIDNYPLMAPFDISSVQIQLPTWANNILQNPLPTPSFPPQSLLASSTPTATPTDSTTVTPSQSSSPMPTVPEFPCTLAILTLFVVSISSTVIFLRKVKTKLAQDTKPRYPP